jgi:uncharacterized protein with HEPN domain
MLPEARAYLHDIEQATVLIDQFRQSKTFDDYLSDPMLRSGVERQLEIIGEAVSKLSRVDSRTAARLTGRRRITALRNILIHGYASVDDPGDLEHPCSRCSGAATRGRAHSG